MGEVVKLDLLPGLLKEPKRQGKKIVHCHGCFDLMHPGHIKYFQASRKMGDLLIVTVSPDEYVDKGEGRPVFNQNLRVESIAALECVDYAAVNKWPTAEETISFIRPDVYVKGQEFDGKEDKTGKLQKEQSILNEIGGDMRYTHEIVFSSTKLLNEYFK